MKRIIAIIVAALLALAAGAGVYYFTIYRKASGVKTGRVSSTSEDAVYVDSVKLVAGLSDGTGLIARYAGVVEPQETWEAKLEGDKTVKTTYVKEGDEVKAGDRLFTYNTAEDEDKLEQTRIDLERNEAELENQKFQLESWEKQKPKDDASDETKLDYTATLLQYQTDVKTTEYEIRQTKKDIETLEETINSAEVHCELDGVVRKISNPNSSSGNYYGGESSDAYITVMAVGDYRVKGTVNEQHINELAVGEKMLAFSRVDDQVWSGTVTEIKTGSGDSNQSESGYGYDSSSDSGSTNYPFYVMLDNSEGLLLGQHVYLEPDQGQNEHKEGIWIPDYYIEFDEQDNASVWRASEDNKLEKQPVELGEYDGSMEVYQVLSGLEEDDYITFVDEGLSEGLPVIYVDYAEETAGMREDLFADDGSLWDDEDWFDEGSYWDSEDVWYDAGSWDEEDLEDVWYDEGSYYVDDGSLEDEDGVYVEDDSFDGGVGAVLGSGES